MADKKIAFVTGGVGGIGSAICEELESRGNKVVAGYHPAEKERAEAKLKAWKDAGRDIDIVMGDVTSIDDCVAMANTIKEKHGLVQILVNCAGITKDKSFKKMEKADWDVVLTVNLDSVFNVTKQFVDGMTDAGYGRVVNISSVNGKKGQFGQTNYAASKAGMHGFTMALAQEVIRKGVTVNTIAPGYVATEMTAKIPEDAMKQILTEIPAGRMAKPEEIAFTVAFLADERSSFITGANISVNGGQFISF